MAAGDANNETATQNTNLSEDDELQAALDQAAATDPKPVEKVKIKGKKDPGLEVPVNIEETKRRKLGHILELLRDFTPKEVKAIVKVDKRRRKAEKLEGKNAVDIGSILGK